MNWKREAVDNLSRYSAQRESLINIPERISTLEAQALNIKGAALDRVPTHGGGTHIEDRTLDNIVERERLKHTYSAVKRLVKLVERGLNGLTVIERRVLELFFIEPARGNVERLMEELGYEKAQIYRIKDEALYRFTITMYGLVDY